MKKSNLVVFVCGAQGEPMIEEMDSLCRLNGLRLMIVSDSTFLCAHANSLGVDSASPCDIKLPISEGQKFKVSDSSIACEKAYFLAPKIVLRKRFSLWVELAERIIKKQDPILVIQRPGGEIGRLVFHRLCREYNIPCLTFGERILDMGSVIYENEFKSLVRRSFDLPEATNNASPKFDLDYISEYSAPVASKKTPAIKKAIALIKRNDLYTFWTYAASRVSYIVQIVSKKLSSILYSRNIEGNFYFMPLNVQAESELYIRNSLTSDQYKLIRVVLGNMPRGKKLLIKEHPGVAKSMSFYNLLKLRLSGVSILSPNISARLVVSKSKGVIINSSTVGLEAVALNIPVIILGNWPFKKFLNKPEMNRIESLYDFFNNTECFLNSKSEFFAKIKPYLWPGAFYDSVHDFRTAFQQIINCTVDVKIDRHTLAEVNFKD